MVHNRDIMKKFLLVSVFINALAGIAWTAPYVVQSTLPARASLSPQSFQGQIYLQTKLYNMQGTPLNLADDVEVSSISWDVSSISIMGGNGWLTAPVYLRMNSATLDASGGIQIYTNNAALTTEPDPAERSSLDVVSYKDQYQGLAPLSGLYATWLENGVVKSGGAPNLGLAWRIVDITTDTLTVAENSVTHQLGSVGLPSSYPCWLRMIDLNDNGINGQEAQLGDYSKLRDSINGIQIAEGTFVATPFSTSFIYFAANFASVLAGNKYKATIVIDAFTE